MGRRALAFVLVATACGGASQSNVRALGGILSVAPATLDFGDVALGMDQTRSIVVRNTGLVSMTVSHLDEFQDPAFEVSGLPATLGPGASLDVTVRYRPPQLGAHEKMLRIGTDSPSSDGADVDLRGNAVRGLAKLSGDSFDFGPVVVNETATQDLLVTNDDGHALTAIAIAPPQDPGVFSVAPGGQQPVPADQSIIVRLQFRPDRLGSFASTVSITPCPTCSPRQITLTGTGVDKLLVVQPATLDFGELRLAAQATKSFTITNISKSPVSIDALTLSGSADLSAALAGATPPRTLQPGETVAGSAVFHPQNLGAQQTQASFRASDGGPGLLAMTGTGIGPVLQVSPKSLFVGATALGTTRTATVTVTNVGVDPSNVAPLALTAVSITGNNDGTWSVQGGAMMVGAPGSKVDLPVSFTPIVPGRSQATLVIESNDGMHPRVEVPLSALGRDLLPCQLQVSPAAPVDFGAQRLFVPIVEGFELINQTADDCIVGDPAIVSGAPTFRWPGGVAPSGRTLPPGGRMSVRLEFMAERAETFAGAVRFYVSNKSAPSMTVDMIGSGDPSCFFVTPPTVDFGATTLGCGVPNQFAYAVNQCSFPVTVMRVDTTGAPFSATASPPIRIQPNTNAAIPISYQPPAVGDDVGAVRVYTDMRAEPFQSGITGGAQTAATIVDQWDQSTPKVDMLIVIDNSGSMKQEQQALAQNLGHLWNRIALANADYHIAVTTTGMNPWTGGLEQCPGGANGGEAGRFFPVDNSRPRMLTPQTPNVRDVLFANTNVGICNFDERFLDPVLAALTDPLISSTKAPGTPWPNDGNAGFLRDDARLALLAVSDADDANDVINPPPVSDYVRRLAQVKKGALDLVSFAGIVPLTHCEPQAEGIGTRYMEIAKELNGHLEDICNLANMGPMLESSMSGLLMPLTSFPLSAHPRDPAAIAVTVNGVAVTTWTYDPLSNRIVFPAGAVPPPGSHITARYEPGCL